jgi:hypothetical protein
MNKLNIGMSSIVVIFIILCMTSFSTLSYVTAHNDYKLTQISVQHTTAYQTACNLAEEQLALLDDITTTAEQSQNFYKETARLCKETANISVKNKTFSYEIDMNDTQKLSISGILTANKNNDNTHFTVKQWKVISK